MTQSYRLIAFGLTILLMASLACTLPGQTASTPDPAGIAEKAQQTLEKAESPLQEATTEVLSTAAPPSTSTPQPTATSAQADLPVGLRQGLASLDSYRLVVRVFLDGPGTQDINHVTTTTVVDSPGDKNYTRVESLASSAEDPNNETSTIEQYRAGLVQCSLPVDEGESPLEEILPIQKEMNDTLASQTDFMIYVADPVLVGEETVNGVAARHFRFTVSGLGDTSGAEVTQSGGEYWSALDGNYLVKYILKLETRTAPAGSPDAQAMRAEITLDLSEINQAVSINMPPECQ